MSGTVPLCKLHGSLSWAIEGGSLRAYADCRPAYRRSNISYVVPPQPEKRAPTLLAPQWEAAAQVLTRTDTWLSLDTVLPVRPCC